MKKHEYKVIPITELREGDIVAEHGSVFRALKRHVSEAHPKDKTAKLYSLNPNI